MLTKLTKRPHRLGIVLLIGLLWLLVLTPALHAQDDAPSASTVETGVVPANAGATVTLTVATAPTGVQSGQEDTVFGAISPTTWDWWLRMLSAVVISALGAWAIFKVIQYVSQMQNRYYDATEHLAARGQSVRSVVIAATALPSPSSVLEGSSDAPPDAPPAPAEVKFKVSGPHVLTIGVESADFTAVLIRDGAEAPADDTVTWQVVPDGAAILSKTKGAAIRLTPQQIGAFDLVVTATGAVTAAGGSELHFPVAVNVPASSGIALPFIGEGWGTIILAVLFGVIIALLGLSRVLSTSLVGTLLGALLGYLFGVVAPNMGNSSSKPSNPTKQPPAE